MSVSTTKNGKYFLTSFGKVVYEAQELVGNAFQHSSKLKAIDSIESTEFPAAERKRIIDTLIDNSKIKEILVSPHYNIVAEKEIELSDSAPTIRSSIRFNP
jgi:hypothetical protein